MPARSKVAMLPHDVLTELERRMKERAFSGYRELAQWLQTQGYQIADDSVQRYGARLQCQVKAIKLAAHQSQAMAEAALDNETTTSIDAMLELAQKNVLAELAASRQPADIARLARAMVDLSRVTSARRSPANDQKTRREQPKPGAGKRLAKGEGGLSTPVYNAMFNMLVGKYIDEPAPDSELSVEEHRKIREGLAETGVLIPLALDDPRRSPIPPIKSYAPESPVAPALKSPDPGVSSPAGAAPQPPVSSLPPNSIAPAHTERPSPQVAAHRPVPPGAPTGLVSAYPVTPQRLLMKQAESRVHSLTLRPDLHWGPCLRMRKNQSAYENSFCTLR